MFDSTVMWNNNPRSMKRDIWRVDSVLHNGRRFRLNYSVSMSWPLQRSSDRIGIYCSDNIEDREPKSVEEGIEEFEMKLNNLDTIQTRFSSNI